MYAIAADVSVFDLESMKLFLKNNWSIIGGVVAALLALKLLKSGVKIALGVFAVAIIIDVLTNLDIMPSLTHFSR